MTDVHVVWHTTEPGVERRGYWDQGWLEAIFDGSLYRPAHRWTFIHHAGFEVVPDEVEAAIVVVPARWHVDDLEAINKGLARFARVLLVLTGDEESLFNVGAIEHPSVVVWRQTPRPDEHREGDRPVGDFWPPGCPGEVAIGESIEDDRPFEWFFAGQVNTDSRAELAEVLGGLHGGILAATQTFGSGLDYPTYVGLLTRSKIVPCPSGPFTPDTFRLFEALEAGAVPVVEATAPNRPEVKGYWEMLFGARPPFPVVDGWRDFAALRDGVLDRWPEDANRVSAWWQGYKRRLAWSFFDDVTGLLGLDDRVRGLDDLVTVLVSTSPSALDPDTRPLETTLESIRDELPQAEIVLMADGVRDEQADRAAAYHEYRRRVARLAENGMTYPWSLGGIVPLFADKHLHQAAMTKRALKLVRTPLVLFVEHDTPLQGEIPWDAIAAALLGDRLDLVRFHHETAIPEEHEAMMLDSRPVNIGGVPLRRTAQWSQRPHLARTEFYRFVANHFGRESRTMIEDVMHGVCWTHFAEQGADGWARYRQAIYHPEGSIKRSGHLDSRGNDPKFPMHYAYDGPVPFGAPQPS